MPSKSPAQHRLMTAVANNPKFAEKVGIPQTVGKEFASADKRSSGYSTKAMINRPDTRHGSIDMPYTGVLSHVGKRQGGAVMRSKRDIAVDQISMAPFRKGNAVKEPKAMMKKEIAFMQKKGAPKSMLAHEKREAREAGYARGGGIERRGKTKGTMIKMNRGGRAC